MIDDTGHGVSTGAGLASSSCRILPSRAPAARPWLVAFSREAVPPPHSPVSKVSVQRFADGQPAETTTGLGDKKSPSLRLRAALSGCIKKAGHIVGGASLTRTVGVVVVRRQRAGVLSGARFADMREAGTSRSPNDTRISSDRIETTQCRAGVIDPE